MNMQCPKCRGNMRTHNRNNVMIEQCDNCRGIFLDYGELEALLQLQSQWLQQQHMPPPPAPPAAPGHHASYPTWGAPPQHHSHHYYHKKHGLLGMLFST